jgi:hypothetical protein
MFQLQQTKPPNRMGNDDNTPPRSAKDKSSIQAGITLQGNNQEMSIVLKVAKPEFKLDKKKKRDRCSRA